MDLKVIKYANRKTGEELQQYLQFKRSGSLVRPKKGKSLIPANKNINK